VSTENPHGNATESLFVATITSLAVTTALPFADRYVAV
jgi:hypothetical protein